METYILKGGIFMKEFWKDCWDLTKHSGRFCKKHWKGMIVLTSISYVSCYGIGYAIIYEDTIKKKLKKKFHKHKDEE